MPFYTLADSMMTAGRMVGSTPFRLDIDGDKRRDGIVLLDRSRVGVVTAAGVRSVVTVPSAKPFTVLGAEDADGDGRDELFVQVTTLRGKSHLVSLEGHRNGDTVSWSRTIVAIDGDETRNGRVDQGTYTTGEDAAAIRLLREASCGEDPLDAELGA